MSVELLEKGDNIPFISYASSRRCLSDSKKYPWFFRVIPSDEHQGAALARRLEIEHTEVGMIFSEDGYSRGLAESFSNHWLKMGSKFSFSISDVPQELMDNIKTALIELRKTTDCSVIVLSTEQNYFHKVLKTAADLG
eukprot:UN25881